MLDNDLHKLVDDVLGGKYENVHTEKGLGRKVYIFDRVVVKVPRTTDDSEDNRSGSSQMCIEKIIYENYNSKMLCPILEFYKGCIIMKRIETNPDIMLSFVPEEKEISEFLYDMYWMEIDKLVKDYNLEIVDLLYMNNWGFDEDSNTFKCVDYGLVSKEVRCMDLF